MPKTRLQQMRIARKALTIITRSDGYSEPIPLFSYVGWLSEGPLSMQRAFIFSVISRVYGASRVALMSHGAAETDLHPLKLLGIFLQWFAIRNAALQRPSLRLNH